MGLSFESIGHGGQAVLALHGWLGDHTAFAPLLDAVDGHHFTWILPAYRGYGLSADIDGRYTVDEAARDCLELLDRLGHERCSVVGHSMGGKVMLRILSLAPSRVRAMIGVAPVPANRVPFDPGGRALFERAAGDPRARREIVDFSTGRCLPGAWIENVVHRSVRSTVPAAVSSYFRSWADDDFHDELPAGDVPLEIILGARDPSITLEAVERSFRPQFPSARVEVFPECGHYPVNEAPLAVARRVDDVLRRAVGAA